MSDARAWLARWRELAPVGAAAAQLVLLVVVPLEAGVLTLVLAEAVVALGVAVSLVDTPEPRRAIAAFAVLWAVATAGLAVGIGRGNRTWLLGLVLVLAAALVAYGLHRYERVALGLVTEAEG